MELAEPEARRRFAAARVAHLATVGTGGPPLVVPITFAVAGDVLVTAVDHKPKRHGDLRRLRDVAATGRVSALVDHYDDADWTALWWVRADGRARIVEDGDEHAAAVGWLRARYPQYQAQPPAGPVIWVEVTRWRSWQFGGAPGR